MELNPYLHYVVSQERRADAIRDAERWRLIQSLKVQGSSPGWLQRLRLRWLVPARPDHMAGKPRPGARPIVSGPAP
jgi:hypothetical protein